MLGVSNSTFFDILDLATFTCVDGQWFAMRSGPGIEEVPEPASEGVTKCKWGSNWNRWSLRSMGGGGYTVHRGINSLLHQEENDGSANLPLSHQLNPPVTLPPNLLTCQVTSFSPNTPNSPSIACIQKPKWKEELIINTMRFQSETKDKIRSKCRINLSQFLSWSNLDTIVKELFCSKDPNAFWVIIQCTTS